jgi:hypothetical protein
MYVSPVAQILERKDNYQDSFEFMVYFLLGKAAAAAYALSAAEANDFAAALASASATT